MNEKPFPIRVLHRLRRRLMSSSIVAIVSIAIIYFGVVSGGRPAASPLPSSIEPFLRVATMRAVELPGYDVPGVYVGLIEARRSSQLSFELPGLLTDVILDEGDLVGEGEVIATLDTQLLAADRGATASELAAANALLAELREGPRPEVIAAAKADLQSSQARAELAGILQGRNEKLVRSSAVSRQELDDATYNRVALSAELTAAAARLRELVNGTRREQIDAQAAKVQGLEAKLRSIDIRIAKSTLRAPFGGIISKRYIDEGTVLEPGHRVVELLESARLEARIGISTESLAAVRDQPQHELLINGQTYIGEVRSISPDRNQKTRTISVVLEIDHGSGELRVGDLARLTVVRRMDEPVYRIPIASLTESYRGLWSALVAEAQRDVDVPVAAGVSVATPGLAVLQTRELEVLHQTDQWAFVRGNLQDGDQIVSDGMQRVVPGQWVRVGEQADAAELVSTHTKPTSVGSPTPLNKAR